MSFKLKGDTVRSEMCGAVFAARLATFVIKNSSNKFHKIYHFIDSMTVLGAINKESYGFSTFYANRIGEIRASTNPENWFWVQSASKKGPEWLYLPESQWPLSREISERSESEVQGLQRKVFSKMVTRSQSKQANENKHWWEVR